MATPLRKVPSKTLKQKHPVYYIPEGDSVVQAGNTLFRFNLSILHSKSLVLQSILPNTQPSHLPKFDDTHPLQLLETSSADLETLLQILIPMPNSSLPSLATAEHYISLLNIASKYHIPTITSLAAARLHTLPSPGLDPIRKIAIWDQYKLDPYLLRPSFIALCQRDQSLTLQMGLSLGIKQMTIIAAARELYRERVGCKSCGKRKGLSKKEKLKIAEDVVDELFFKGRPKGTASKLSIISGSNTPTTSRPTTSRTSKPSIISVGGSPVTSRTTTSRTSRSSTTSSIGDKPPLSNIRIQARGSGLFAA